MGNYALIKSGICHNVIDADGKFIEKIKPEWDAIIPAENTMAERGATWDGKIFIRKAPISVIPVKSELQEIKDTLAKIVEKLAIE